MTNVVPFAPRSVRQQRMDALTNKLTGYNTVERDHGQGYNWEIRGQRLGKEQRDDMYARHELVWKIINLLPDNALRPWVSFPKLEEVEQKKIRKLIRDTKIREALKKGFRMARLHGGASLYAPLNDGRFPDQPLNINSLKSVGVYKVYEIDYLYPDPAQLDRSLNFEHFIMLDSKGVETRIHISRLIILPGADCGDDWRASHGGAWPNYLERCIEPLVAYCAAHGIVPNILKDIIRDVIKLAGLNQEEDKDDADEQDAFNRWLDALMRAESLINKTVLDADDDYIRQTTNTQGVPETIGTTERRLTAAIGYPHTILLGESPGASLSQAGSSQKKDWNESTANFQQDEVKPALDSFMALAEAVLNIDEIEYVFNPLDTPSTEQKAKVLNDVASAVEKLIRSKIVTKLEAASLFEGDEVRTIPVLDIEARKAFIPYHSEMIEEMLNAAPEKVQPINQMNGGPDDGQRERDQSGTQSGDLESGS